MSNLSSYGYGLDPDGKVGVSGYGYGIALPVGLVASLDLLTTFGVVLDPLEAPVDELDTTLALTTSLTGSLQFIPIGQLLASLDLETSFAASVVQPAAELLASLDLTTTFSGVLQFIPIAELQTTLGLETSFATGLQFIPIPEILSALDLELSYSVALSQPTASLQELESILGLKISAITTFLVPEKVLIDQYGEFIGRGGPFDPAEFEEFVGVDGNVSYSGYLYYPVLKIEVEESGVTEATGEKSLIVVYPAQKITYQPKKPGGATLWRP